MALKRYITKVRDTLSRSYYLRVFANTYKLLLLSILAGIFFSLISDPGIWYSDSYWRVSFADVIGERIKDILKGERPLEVLECWLTYVPSIFIWLCKLITGNILTYTVVQSTMFFYVIFLVIRKLDPPLKGLSYLLYIICPLIYGASVYCEAGIGCVTSLLILVLFINDQSPKTYLDFAFELVAIAILVFVVVGYRANALSVIPVLLLFVIWFYKSAYKKLLLCLSILLGVGALLILPSILVIDTMGSSGTGFVWEILVAINELEPASRTKYETYFDDIAVPGATARALEADLSSSVNGFMRTELNRSAISDAGTTKLVFDYYLPFAIENPSAFLRAKLMILSKTLGFSGPLNYPEFNYNRWERMDDYGFNDCKQRKLLVDSWHTFCEFTPVFRTPWFMFVLTGLLLAAHKKLRVSSNLSSSRSLFMLLFWLSIFYYLPFLITNQSIELRYFFPSLLMMLLIDTAISFDFLFEGIKPHLFNSE